MMLFSVLDQHFRTANYRKLASSDHLHKTLIYLFLFSLLIFGKTYPISKFFKRKMPCFL